MSFKSEILFFKVVFHSNILTDVVFTPLLYLITQSASMTKRMLHIGMETVHLTNFPCNLKIS